MQERDPGRIQADMDVCDVDGDKVGTVARVYRHDVADVASVGTETAPTREELAPGEEVLEVKTGLLGLGTHYYVPLGAVRDVTAGAVFLSKRKAEFEGLGWHRRPSRLGELE
jgi:hypothetical protein